MATIRIDNYTGNWQRALSPPPAAPEIGERVETCGEPDAREWDDFCAILKLASRRLEWLEYEEDGDLDIYEVVAA